MDWTGYYDAQAGRAVRSVVLQALASRNDAPPGVAIDIGCGEGTETRHLLANGWCVLAIDADPASEVRVRARLTPEQAARLTFRRARFEDVGVLPAADLVYSTFALPFCEPAAFPTVWSDIRASLKPGAWFAGELFGPHDSWSGRADMNFHDRPEVQALLAGLTVHTLDEDDRTGQSAFGPRHWHVFHIIAHNPA